MPDPTTVALDRTLTGQPSTHQGYSLVPIARLTGWEWGAPGQGGVGAFVRLTPAEVRVTAPDGTESTVALTNTEGQAVRGMFGAAGMVAAVSAVVILLAKAIAWRSVARGRAPSAK